MKKYEAMVLSCMDPRLQEKVFRYLKSRKLTGKYSSFTIAGAAIGVSHLVQSTRAGADFGWGLIWALLIINFFNSCTFHNQISVLFLSQQDLKRTEVDFLSK